MSGSSDDHVRRGTEPPDELSRANIKASRTTLLLCFQAQSAAQIHQISKKNHVTAICYGNENEIYYVTMTSQEACSIIGDLGTESFAML